MTANKNAPKRVIRTDRAAGVAELKSIVKAVAKGKPFDGQLVQSITNAVYRVRWADRCLGAVK